MTKYRILPHLTADVSDIELGSWWYRLPNGEPTPIEEPVQGWDYSTPIQVGSTFIADRDALKRSTSLEIDQMQLVTSADCSAVSRRFWVRQPVLNGSNSIQLTVPAGQAAGELQLSICLIALENSMETRSFVASRLGSRLYTSPAVSLQLEGVGSRFPTEVVNFSEHFLGSAPWTVLAYFDDLSDSFMGSVRLYINNEHQLAREILNPGPDSINSQLMRIDLIRLLIATVSSSKLEIELDTLEEDSVGSVINRICLLYLNMRLDSVVQIYAQDPAKFERILHEGIQLRVGDTR